MASVRIGRIAGIPIEIDPTFPLVLPVVAWIVGSQVGFWVDLLGIPLERTLRARRVGYPVLGDGDLVGPLSRSDLTTAFDATREPMTSAVHGWRVRVFATGRTRRREFSRATPFDRIGQTNVTGIIAITPAANPVSSSE